MSNRTPKTDKTPATEIDAGLYTITEPPKPPKRKRDLFNCGFDAEAMAQELYKHAQELHERSKGRAGAIHATAAQAAREARMEAIHALEEIARAPRDFKAAFRAGWALRKCLDLLGGWQASHGKRMNPNRAGDANRTALKKRKGEKRKREIKLQESVYGAWEDYCEDNPEGSALDFAENWLFDNADAYDITADIGENTFSRDGREARPRTVRAWVKDRKLRII